VLHFLGKIVTLLVSRLEIFIDSYKAYGQRNRIILKISEMQWYLYSACTVRIFSLSNARGSAKDLDKRHLTKLERQLTKEITNDFKRFAQDLTKCQLVTSHFSAYFGKSHYGYGRPLHKPCEYPADHPMVSMVQCISEQLDDPTFNFNNISCRDKFIKFVSDN
jgi:hypothetical protein